MYKYPITVQVYKGWGVRPGTIYIEPQNHVFAFVVRGMTRKEYSDWQAAYPDPVDLEGHILRECVMSQPGSFLGEPWNWDTCFAGVAAQVIDKIYNVSGLGSTPDPEIVQLVEGYLNSPEARFDMVIMTAYNYKLEDLMSMDHRDWHMLVGLAQYKLEMMGIDTEAILYPERAKNRKGGVAVPKGMQASAHGGSPGEANAMGGAKPFFSNAAGRDPHSPYPVGHPKNPAIMEDPRSGIVPGAEGPVVFTS